MTNYIIPVIVLIIIIYGFYKKVDLFENFLIGVKEGTKMMIKIFPTIFTMMIAVKVLIESNIINDIAKLI